MSDKTKSLDDDRTVASRGSDVEGHKPPPDDSRNEDVTLKGSDPRKSSSSGRGRFYAEDLIAGRYRVIRFLARGGMGEVYEVEDTVLGDRVALKTVLPEIAENPKALGRFRRETFLARKVTHPNVCRIFDIGRHEDDGEETLVFLTMELLEGETLAERLRHGRLETVEALPLVEQMCSGLEAAHAVGIVHRDFKPANVFLVPGEDGSRVVITDFGLARPGGGASDAGVTGTGEIIGTPAYMAPEQLEGGLLGPETDIYSLGLVMYEMLTGTRAFDGDTAFQIAVKRLQETPTSPSSHLPDLDPKWERCIMRCLEKTPSSRIRRARDIPRVLRGEAPIRPPGLWSGFRIGLYGLVGFLVLLGAWTLFRIVPTASLKTRTSSPQRQASRQSAAVLGFRNVSGDASKGWISTAISEVLTTELGSGNALRAIPGETVSRCLRDLGIDQVQSLDPETLRILYSNLGADLAVLGSYTVVPGGQTIRLDVRLQDVHSGEVMASRSETGPIGDFLSLVEKVARGLKSELDIHEAPRQTRVVSLPKDPKAARLYSEGVGALRSYKYSLAREKLEAADKISPDSAAVLLQLSEVWRRLGYLPRSLEAARKAVQLSAGLDREQRLSAEARVAELSGKPREAIRAWDSLWTFFPDNPDYGLALTDAQTGGGEALKALETVAQLRKLPEPTSSDPRVDLAEAHAAGALGQFDRQLQAATRALNRARSLGARQLEAQSFGVQVSAMIRLGKMSEAEETSLKAEKIWKELQDANGVAKALHQRAILAYRKRDLEQARDLFQKVLDAYQSLGAQGGVAEAYNGLGGIHLAGGDAKGGKNFFRKALEIYTKIGDTGHQATILGNLAVLAQRQGDFASAIDDLERARVILRDAGAEDKEAIVLRNIAATYYGRGDLGEARKAFERAIALDRQTGHRAELAGSLFALGDLLAENAEWAEAERRFAESREISVKIEDKGQEARAEFGSIVLRCEQYLLDPGAIPSPRADLIAIRKKLKDEGISDAAVLAGVFLMRLDEAAGDRNGASQTLGEIQEMLKDVPDFGTGVAVEIASSRLKALGGSPEKAAGELKLLQQQVEQSGILSLGYQVRLARGETMLRSPALRAKGRSVLEELQRETQPRGWRLLNRRIALALSSVS